MRAEGNDKQHQENKKQQLGDAGGSDGYPGKTQHCSNNRNHKKHQRPIKHNSSSSNFTSSLLDETAPNYPGYPVCHR